MYVADTEERQFSRRKYSGKEKLDLYVKGACVLDKSLKINAIGELCLLTNNKSAIEESLQRIGYLDLKVTAIDFNLNVPNGCRFYTAHFKIDVFRYFATRPVDEYSILLDSDVVAISPFDRDFYHIVEKGLPMVYFLPGYGGRRRLRDASKIIEDLEYMSWAGGEFIGGKASFYNSLYHEICSFKDNYWKNINNDLFHVGDEMLTSIALYNLNKTYVPIDAGIQGFIHRYWSVFDNAHYSARQTPLVHFPGDKMFFYNVNLESDTIDELMRSFSRYKFFCSIKGWIKRAIDKDWLLKL